MHTNPGWWETHGLPNAFFASHPRHPLWLFPLAHTLAIYGVHAPGDQPTANVTDPDPENATGPAALFASAVSYQQYTATTKASAEQPVQVEAHRYLTDALPPILHEMAANSVVHVDHEISSDKAPHSHDVVIFDTGIVYPFSWVDALAGGGLDVKHCRAAPGMGYDPVRCLSESSA
jgi:hypothetical protein